MPLHWLLVLRLSRYFKLAFIIASLCLRSALTSVAFWKFITRFCVLWGESWCIATCSVVTCVAIKLISVLGFAYLTLGIWRLFIVGAMGSNWRIWDNTCQGGRRKGKKFPLYMTWHPMDPGMTVECTQYIAIIDTSKHQWIILHTHVHTTILIDLIG